MPTLIGSQVTTYTGTLGITVSGTSISYQLSGSEASTETGIIAEDIVITETLASVSSFVAEAIHLIAESMDISDTFTSALASRIIETLIAQDVLSIGTLIYTTVEEVINILDSLIYITQITIAESATATDTSTRYLKIIKALAESMAIVNESSAIGKYYKLVTIAMAIADTLIYVQESSITESAAIADTFTEKLLAYPTITETGAIADTASRYLTLYCLTEESLAASDVVSINTILNTLIQENLVFGLVYEEGTETYSGWIVNPENYAVSEYTNYNFNSLAKLNRDYYGANSDGLYKFTGNLDDTDFIEASMTLAALDFDSSNLKQMPYLYLGVNRDGNLILRVSVDGQETVYYTSQTDKDYLDTEEIKLGKGLIGRYWQFSIEVNHATEFDLDTIEFYPVQLGRKRR